MIPENGSLFDEKFRQDEQDETDHENPVDPGAPGEAWPIL